ncbi:hypothetical protein [Aquimarina brevivitae]|uniref:Uncharacterized protein n=1 Tax=Aquimarina brevivitae TaxID=323412 RepID=A0A4Q7P1H6_9FLAO|nr:hypothetical protein [Aquimarina brevivitae]RZS93575.1 hypothetical protein EV197_2155 [Aquimarina brevivitae]
MSKNRINFIATLGLAILLSFVLPWWSIMIAALLSALSIPLQKAAVFFIPFLAIVVFWILYCFILSSANDFILAKKIAQLLQIGGNPYLLILLTGIIGGVAAGISGILGKQLSVVFLHKK